jgi:1-acyl-sn-glycerol-3-phosphate acyltransferase
MIPSRKSRLFNAWFAGHARSRIEGTFGRVYVRGVEQARAVAAERPVLFVPNHTAWWDPLVILHASLHRLEVDAYAMMDAKNLRRLPFFGLVGAFGVDLGAPADGLRAMKYAAKLLDRPRRAVWIFAQGEERPITERPLRFRGGACEVARIARKAAVIPVGLRYEHAGDERPRLYLSFGDSVTLSRDMPTARVELEAGVGAELDRIEQHIRGGEGTGLELVWERRPGWMAHLAERMLAVMTRPFALSAGDEAPSASAASRSA